MQSNFTKGFLIGTAVFALAISGAVVSQAQPGAPTEECDPQACALTAPGDLAAAPAVAPAPTQANTTPETVRTETLPKPALAHADKVEESQISRHESSKESLPARPDKQLAMRKPCREMDDREMDSVAGGITGSFDMTQSGNMQLNDNSTQSLSLSDQAQQNLSSLVNLISINSTISVMMNLNVNINSTVGTVNQGNTGSQVP